MLEIVDLRVEHLPAGCVTDNPHPRFSYGTKSDRPGARIATAQLRLGTWEYHGNDQICIAYDGPELEPYTTYTAELTVVDDAGQQAQASVCFETGKLSDPWKGKWITHGAYRFRKAKASPKPMYFRRRFVFDKAIASAKLYCTAFGVYELELNGQKVGQDYFAPGFTSYKRHMQYQCYDVSGQLEDENTLSAVVAGGWAVGAFTYARRNRVFAKRQALLCELHIRYQDGSRDVIASDEGWETSMEGPYTDAEFYAGEVYRAYVDPQQGSWQKAHIETPKFAPKLLAQYGLPVRTRERLEPVSVSRSPSGKLIYDFGQNFAGVISAEIEGRKGQHICFRHAEILMDGELFTKPLRSAKQEAHYYCTEGPQHYQPRLTYMGFRYVEVNGIEAEQIKLSAFALYTDMESSGSFSCSNEMLNKLERNINWSMRSNFVDIPTDCPQRDERMGWTGDIALFASTASFHMNTARFYEKWLKDLKSEQTFGGGFPVTVPLVRVPMQWEIMIPMAVDHWGDAAILVPWAEYLARGDKRLLEDMYPAMKKYIGACLFWARFLSFGKRRRIWRLLHHYGDWVAPELGLFAWMGRGKWTGTASLARTSSMVAQIATLLGHSDDAAYYSQLSRETSEAYKSVLMDKDCRVKKEFQTSYVLPLHYNMFSGADRERTAAHLSRLVRENGYRIGTGFPGTPYILFALADNGYEDDAFAMLLNETSPSWLYEVKAGGTTIWERWDALREDGSCNTGEDDGTGGMVSFNHYASGAVGDFLYRRVAGIEALEGGYRSFKVKPVIGGDISWAKAEVRTPYGRASSSWSVEGGNFSMEVEVPMGSTCYLELPDGQVHTLLSGSHTFQGNLDRT